MNDLDKQIEEARAATAELARLEELRAALPGLEAERQRRQQQQRAAEQLRIATDNAQRARAEYVDKAPAWRLEFDAWVKDGELLAKELQAIEAPIFRVAQDLAGTINQAGRNEVPTDHPAGAWVALGWADVPEILPNENDGSAGYNPPIAERLGAVLAQAAGITPYLPRRGIRSAGVRA